MQVRLAGAAEVPAHVLPNTRRRALRLRSERPARVLLLGGEPFAEEVVMWWKLVSATAAEIGQARADQPAGTRFGPVVGYTGDPLAAPDLPPAPLRPRGRTR